MPWTSRGSGTPAPAVQWQVSTDGGVSYSNVSGATATATATTLKFVVQSAQNGYRYRAVFTNAVGQADTVGAQLLVW